MCTHRYMHALIHAHTHNTGDRDRDRDRDRYRDRDRDRERDRDSDSDSNSDSDENTSMSCPNCKLHMWWQLGSSHAAARGLTLSSTKYLQSNSALIQCAPGHGSLLQSSSSLSFANYPGHVHEYHAHVCEHAHVCKIFVHHSCLIFAILVPVAV